MGSGSGLNTEAGCVPGCSTISSVDYCVIFVIFNRIHPVLTVVTTVPICPVSSGHGGGPGEWVGLRLGHLQRPGGLIQRPAGRKHHRDQQEVSAGAIGAELHHVFHPRYDITQDMMTHISSTF